MVHKSAEASNGLQTICVEAIRGCSRFLGPHSKANPIDYIDANIWPQEATGGQATKGVIDDESPISRLILCSIHLFIQS